MLERVILDTRAAASQALNIGQDNTVVREQGSISEVSVRNRKTEKSPFDKNSPAHEFGDQCNLNGMDDCLLSSFRDPCHSIPEPRLTGDLFDFSVLTIPAPSTKKVQSSNANFENLAESTLPHQAVLTNAVAPKKLTPILRRTERSRTVYVDSTSPNTESQSVRAKRVRSKNYKTIKRDEEVRGLTYVVGALTNSSQTR